jgi:vitamin-K-epoxide reductase (warfarin-sensitive)
MQAAVSASSIPRTARLLRSIALLSILGVFVSSVSLYHHFEKSKTSFCDLGQSFNCDLVNRSQYSTLAGMPVALIGVVGYLLILSLATVYREKAETPFLLLAASLVGLGFALYLTYVEARILYAWCILCLSSLATMFVIAVLSAMVAGRPAKPA